MAKKKRKYDPKQAAPPEDPQPEYVKGCYVSQLSGDQAAKAQTVKTVLMLVSTLLFAVTLFLPVEGRNALSPYLWLFSLYVLFDVALIVFSVYASYAGQKKHRITLCLDGKYAPNGVLKKHTFLSYEIFNAMHAAYAAIEIAVVCVKFDWWGLISAIAAAGAAVTCFLSRQILYHAYASAAFIPPKTEQPEDGGQADANETAVKKDAAQKGRQAEPAAAPDSAEDATEDSATEDSATEDPAENFYEEE